MSARYTPPRAQRTRRRVGLPQIRALGLLGLAFRSRVQRDGLAYERLECRCVDRVAFVNVDRAPDVAVETRVEQARGILQRRTFGERQLHDALVRLAGTN